MFAAQIYQQRREQLKKNLQKGLLLFLGNNESPMNYAANTYPFRQDSTFLYYWGLDLPGLAAVIDLDEGSEILFGDDYEVDDIVWMGPQPKMRDLAQRVGVRNARPLGDLNAVLDNALRQGRTIHFLPPYRPEHVLKIRQLLGLSPEKWTVMFRFPLLKQW